MIGAKSADELINKPVLELMHPDYKGFAKERIIRAMKDNVALPPATEKIIKLDGTVIDVEITSVPINYGGTKSLQVILRDITEQKRANEQVKKLSQAVEQSPSSIIITDLSGSIEYVNPKFTKVTGYTFEEVIGKNPRILKSGSQSKEFYHNMWNKLTAGNDWKGELHNKKKRANYTGSLLQFHRSKMKLEKLLTSLPSKKTSLNGKNPGRNSQIKRRSRRSQ